MASKFEQIAAALETALKAISGPTVKRNEENPETIPENGLIIIQDGQPADFIQPLGGFDHTYHRHDFEVEMFVQSGRTSTRNTKFDDLLTSVGQKLEEDHTFGGLTVGIDYGRPEVFTEREAGSAAVKAGVLTLSVEYETDTPLA